MITCVTIPSSFAAVPHLSATSLIQTHYGKIKFSTKKVNVIVGPNGSGKSSLVDYLAKIHLAFTVGYSAFDERALERLSTVYKGIWGEMDRYQGTCQLFDPKVVKTDLGFTWFYRPGAIPGGKDSETLTGAMMTGYFEEAKEYGALTKDKSSGQACRSLISELMDALVSDTLEPSEPRRVNWTYSREDDVTFSKTRGSRMTEFGFDLMPWDIQRRVLLGMFLDNKGIPLFLMDEPEQSLDALAESQFWKTVEGVDTSNRQVIIATHSLYPFLHPENFNLIEAEPGYVKKVKEAIS